MQPPEAAGFLQFEGLKQPMIYATNMKNAKNNNANLHSKITPLINTYGLGVCSIRI